MKILVTGANGYIGSQLLSLLLDAGHHVIAMVRHKNGLGLPSRHPNLTEITGDLLIKESLESIPKDIDAAFYLVHTMSYGRKDFPQKEQLAISHFLIKLKETSAKQIIYLSGLCNDQNLSPILLPAIERNAQLRRAESPTLSSGPESLSVLGARHLKSSAI